MIQIKKHLFLYILVIMLVSFTACTPIMNRLKQFQMASANDQAIELRNQGKANQAIPLVEKNLKMSKEILGEKHPDTLAHQNNLAMLYKETGRLAESLQLLEQNYALFKQELGKTDAKTLIALDNLGQAYVVAGQPLKGLPLLEDAYSTRKVVLGEKHGDTFYSLNNLAFTYGVTGKLAESLQLLEPGYQLAKTVFGEDHEMTATIADNLAGIYSSFGRMSEALWLRDKYYKWRLKLLGEKHPNTLLSLNNLALAYQNFGKLKEALPLFEKNYNLRREVFGEKHSETITGLNNLGSIHEALGQTEKALPLREKNYLLAKATFGEKNAGTFFERNNLGLLYDKIGRLPEAIDLLEQNYNLAKTFLSPNHPDTLTSTSNLAYVHIQSKNFDKAINLLTQVVTGVEFLRSSGALSVENRQSWFSQWIPQYFVLAKLYLKNQQITKSFQMVEQTKARTLIEVMTAKLALQLSDLTPAERKQLEQQQVTLADLNYQIIQANTANTLDLKMALENEKDQLLQKIATLHRQLLNKYPKYAKLNEVKLVDPEDGSKLLSQEALFIDYLIGAGKYQNQVIALTLDHSGHLQSYDLGEIPNLEHTLKVYRQLLGNSKNLIELRSKTGDRVWQLKDGSFVIGDQPTEEQEPQEIGDLGKISRYLAQKLLVPLTVNSDSSTNLLTKSRWIISPDGPLALLPFETLVLEDKPVVMTHAISYVQSLSVLALLKQREKAYEQLGLRDSLLAIGNPLYQDPQQTIPPERCNKSERGTQIDIETLLSRGQDGSQTNHVIAQTLANLCSKKPSDIVWCNLKFAEQELNQIENLFYQQKPLIYKQKEATEAKLQTLNREGVLSRYRYLLFSTHGFLGTEECPGLSGLILNQLEPKTDQADGYLMAGELLSYDFKSDLMVLSACHTGLGKVLRGEGVLGLPYALYVAGNKNTLLTLWSISDQSAADLTINFFQKINAGMDQVEALTLAKREFLQTQIYNYPFHWAAFVLYGI